MSDLNVICADIINEIIAWLDLKAVGCLRCTCRYWRNRLILADFMTDLELERRKRCVRLRHKNDYWDLLSKHMTARIIPIVSRSRHVTLDLVLENDQIGWCWASISGNPNITMRHVISYPNLPWNNYIMLVRNPNITPNDINDIFVAGYYITNPATPLDWTIKLLKFGIRPTVYRSCWIVNIVEQFPEHEWEWGEISQSDYLTVEFIQKYKSKLRSSSLSRNPVVTAQLIDRYPNDDDWDWYQLSWHPAITIELVCKHREKPWCWYALTKHKNITMKMIKDTDTLPWESDRSQNPNATLADITDVCFEQRTDLHEQGYVMDLIVQNPNGKWFYPIVSKNPRLTMSFVKDNVQRFWDWESVSANENISFEDILMNRNLPWNWETVAKRFQ